MYSIHDKQVIASQELYSHLERQAQESAPRTVSPERRTIRTPQRKADYKNKARPRLKDLKRIAFDEYKCSSSAQIKEYLKFLRVKVDLRLTAAWDAIVFELHHEILASIAILAATEPQPIDNGVQTMLRAMREAIAQQNWSIAKEKLATHAEYKAQAWELLKREEKQQLSAIVPLPVKLLTAAKRHGIIADYTEASEEDLYWVRVTPNSDRQLVTSQGTSIFLCGLLTPTTSLIGSQTS